MARRIDIDAMIVAAGVQGNRWLMWRFLDHTWLH
jgi:hypothetical protein